MRRGEDGRSGVVFILVALLLVIGVAGGGTALFARTQLDPPGASGGANVAITVRPGETVDAVISDLAGHGLIRSPFWFGWYAKLQGLAGKLVAGRYQVNGGMSASYIAQLLESAPPVSVRSLLLPEGLTAAQMADRVANAGLGITAAQYLTEVRSGAFSEPFLSARPPGSSLEGFLFPDTYQVPDHATAHDVVQLQLAAFAAKAVPLFKGAAPAQLYERLMIASIAEREARVESDRALVTSVIDNRLAAGMVLGMDSTVLYGLGLNGDVLTVPQLHQDTPYNTYIHAGLPPTPISNPGASSIVAAVTPASTSYLFFVSDSCGHNHYSVTLREHNQQIAQYIGTPCPSPS